MKTFERILAALDFSAPSNEAMRIAVDLARRYGAKLDLLFVFEPTLHLEQDDFRLLTPEHLCSITIVPISQRQRS